ncbi:FAD/NAD(P)-binding domain-containing protein [Mollisia scopiformis]|uniref:FAD/NAD(P)-binding domain-containing protein n=1 Tax=Mollisia scopiformis TaxID=149040 RepID=A0A194WYD1_MOLSC|nr:FAD/NAD(P)-binding domain-containing protein [Mollisia scopiformis]KUJ12617.1 FAD/NAD(P)-binding domain-containing protein [Mollisia scopiformis]
MAPSLEDLDATASDVRVDGKQGASDSVHLSQKTLPTSAPEVPRALFQFEDHPIDSKKRIRVAVIGAGIAGVTAGVLLPIKVPGIDLQIFEKNTEVGGTWFENVYPGVRCDIPANVYQSTFEPNTQWTEEYAQGAEILEYWKKVARKYNVYKYLRFGQNVLKASWDESKAQWLLDIKNLESEESRNESFDVIISAIGRFNAWKLPDYPGISEYKGHLRHSSAWDKSLDPKDKVVAVIGNGASGLQVVPNIQKVVKQLDHYARSKAWIAGSFGGEGPGRRLEPNYYPEEQLKSFEDPETYLRFRKELEGKLYQNFGNVFKGTGKIDSLREEFKELMSSRLVKKPELLDSIIPDFSPNCRRLTPGPGYLEALTEDNVHFITTPISHFTEFGIVTTDGIERKVDAVICATGANIDMRPPFPIIANGKDLRDAWTPSPITYLGLASPDFPNLLILQGPNSVGPGGTVPNQMETQVTYMSKLLRKVASQGIKSFVPSQAATDDFIAYCDSFFPRTVFSENCSSWANGGKPGGRIHGHWPGSATHANLVRRDPRWEDWEWTYKNESGNRFAWLGNGWTQKEKDGEGDLTPYLKLPRDIDLRSYHEEWFEGVSS